MNTTHVNRRHLSEKSRVLIFSLVNFSNQNGGVACTATLLKNIRGSIDANFTFVSAGNINAKEANNRFAASLQLDHVFLQIPDAIASDVRPPMGRLVAINRELFELLLDKYYYYYERFYLKRQTYLDPALNGLIEKLSPHLIVIDGSWSALCAPSISRHGIPCCLITHNHEVNIHRDFKFYDQDSPRKTYLNRSLRLWIARHFNWVSNARFKRRIDRVYTECAGIIALTSKDLPNYLPETISHAVFPPLLEDSEPRWQYQQRRSILYVGNINYFANRLAIEWLCKKLSPELLRIDESIRIYIIGATEGDIGRSCRANNVCFLGSSDKEEVIQHMTTDDLLIAPTAQAYGAKLKLAECASHGMPFLATETAMAGLPFLTFSPRIDLEKPDAAAHLIMTYLNNPTLLIQLSRDTIDAMEKARRQQVVGWHSFLESLLA